MGEALRSRRAFGLLLASVVVCQGCGGAREGWQRLWPEQWAWAHRGRILERGVAADGRLVTAEHGGIHLRASLFNHGAQQARALLMGPHLRRGWGLAGGERKFIDIRLPRAGRYRFSASADVILGEPRMGLPIAQPKLVVLILVDTLRADHVNQELMPGVWSFFSKGHRWGDASADAPWTVPSVASLFTARPVLDLTTPEGDLLGVPEGMPTWAEALERAGFSGGAVVANYTIQVLNGFGKGFGSFLVPDGHGSSHHPDATWVVDNARAWLAAHRGENGFLYLHLMDPHEPYRDHSGRGRVAPSLQPFAHRDRVATASETALFKDLYAGEVRHVDQVLTPFLHDLGPHAVVALTADHGEALGEHGCWGHGLNLYQEALHIPFMLRGPGVAAGESGQPEQLIDLTPTLLDLVGVERERSMIGRSMLSGGSRVPLVAATFGAGPLRWCWRRGADKVVIRMAPQPGLASVARSTMEEGHPLPTGAVAFRLDRDPQENEPLPLDGKLTLAAGRAFVATTARFVPGLQVLAWGEHGRLRLSLDVSGKLEPAQVFAVAPVALRREGRHLSLSCTEAFPVCGIAGTVVPKPWHVRLPADGGRWLDHEGGGTVPLTDLSEPPYLQAPGVLVWWNPPRERLVKGYRETLRRLRDLGYLQ